MGFLLSGFADEAGVMIEQQMDVLQQNGIRYIEIRNVNGKHVLELTEEELLTLKKKLDDRGFAISAIGSPVGKTLITEPFEVERQRFIKAVQTATILQAKYIRAFSFYLPASEKSDPMSYAEEIVMRLKELVAIAEENHLIYALENESGVFGDTTERILFLVNEIGSKHFQVVFDPGNFVHNQVNPYPDAFESLKDHLAYFHIKDASQANRQFVPAGEGDSNFLELLLAAKKIGFSGFLSIEPHLGYLTDYTQAQQFTVACNALKRLLNQAFDAGLEIVDLQQFV